MIAHVLLLLCLLQTGWSLQLSSQQTMMGKDVNIPCSFTVKSPPIDRKYLSINWYFQGKEILSVQNTKVKSTDPRISYKGRAEDGIADLSIANITIMDGGIYKCSILYTPKKEEKEIRLDIQAPPRINITDTVVVQNKEGSICCVISGYYPVDIDIKWLRDGEKLDKVILEKPQRNPDGTYNVRSSVTLTPTREDRERTFSCRVQHESLTAPLQEDFQLVYGAMPSVHITFQAFKLNVQQNLVCSASEFYPESITVNWYLNDTLVEKAKTRRISSSAVESVYPFTPTDQNWGMELTCVVDHATLTIPHVERLLVQITDLKARYKSFVVIASFVVITLIIVLLLIKKRRKHFFARPEFEVIQIPKLFVSKQTQLQCTVSHFYPDDLMVDWLIKEEGKEKFPINASGSYNVPKSGSQLQSDKTFTRTEILEFTPSLKDQGSEIICRVRHPSLKEPIERTTGPLQVLVKPELQQPVQLSVTDSGDVVGSLTLLNFYPKNINVTWTCNSIQTNQNIQEDGVICNPDGTFTLDSQYKIPGKLLENKQFMMKVTWKHKSMETPEYREISIHDQDFPWRPRIEDMSPLILQVGQKTNVMCKISSYFPGNLRVTWLEKRGEILTLLTNKTNNYHIPDIEHERMADNTYQCSPFLSFTPRSDREDLEFICRVEHPSLEQPIQQSTGPPRIKVPPQEPKDVEFTLLGPDKVLCSLSLMKFYPQNIDITWSYVGHYAIPLPSTKKIIQTDNEKTFDAISECTIPWKRFMSSVRVTWKHDSLMEARYRDLHITDPPWRPMIEEIDNSPLLENTEVRLQYKISRYLLPSELAVTWHKKEKNGEVTDLLNYPLKFRQLISSAQLQPDNTYSCTIRLLITPTLTEDQETEFICSVNHPSLKTPIERSTGPLQVCACPKFQEPIKWSLQNRTEAVLILHLYRFYPRSIDIKWRCSCGQLLISKDDYENYCNSMFKVTSGCKVSQEHMIHPDPAIRVTWKHVAMTDPESREVRLRNADFLWRPEVMELSNPVLLSGRSVIVESEISNFFPNNLTVTWFVKERGDQDYVRVDLKGRYKTTISQPEYSDSGYFCTTSVQFIPSLSSHHGVMFMCEVKHPSLENPIERITKPLFITMAPRVTDSVKLTPCESEEVLCSVRLEKFFPKSINFTWSFGGKKYSQYILKKTLLVEDELETYGVISECRIPWKLLTFPIQVTWEHESTAKPQSKELPGPVFPWCPQIEVLDTPYLILNTESKIQCRISGYFPKDLTVNWFKEEERTRQPVPVDGKYKTPQFRHQRQPDNTYSCTASLLFTPTRVDQGLVFICKVAHPSLKQPKEERIRPLPIMELLCCPCIDPPETSILNHKYKIQCRISGYSPNTLRVTWLKKSKGQTEFVTVNNNSKYNIPEISHKREPNNTYSCTASLSYEPTHEGSEFICRVDHPSLDQPIEKRTEPLQLEKKPNT